MVIPTCQTLVFSERSWVPFALRACCSCNVSFMSPFCLLLCVCIGGISFFFFGRVNLPEHDNNQSPNVNIH